MDETSSHERCTPLPVLIVVDDEARFRLALAQLLRDDGHTVLEFSCADSAPPVERWPDGAVLLTDLDMPGQNGLDLLDEFRRARPTSAGILLSGYGLPVLRAALAVRPWIRFVPKPLDYDVLHAVVHDLA